MSQTSTAPASPGDQSARTSERRFGGWLVLWMLLVVVSNGFLWGSGIKEQQLIDAIEEGAARVETRSVEADLKPELIRNAIQTQRDTRPFWRTLQFVGDFLIEPLALPLRAYAITVAFAALAAILGRPIGFEAALYANILLQGCWALRHVVAAAIQGFMPDTPVEISFALLLPPGEYPAITWLSLRQLDVFSVAGWLAAGWGACSRRQSPWLAAPLIIGLMAAFEVNVRTSVIMMLGAAMRVSFTMQ